MTIKKESTNLQPRTNDNSNDEESDLGKEVRG